ncbi:MAG: DNA repair protein RecN, partial [Bryobacteraceae bacterium]
MLVELMVENYAVVERLRVRFHRGLNVLTGETGSGKSLVVDALGLLFGGRASVDMIRSGEERARVSGIFEAPPALSPLLDGAGIQLEDGELLVEREILANGKSRAFAGNRPVTAALLRDLAASLGDIHGQHDQQQLFSPEAQLGLLDGFAANHDLLGEVAQVYRLWRQCAKQIEDIEHGEQEKLRLLDLWTFQRNEIESARLQPGEDAALEGERRVLQNVGRLLESANVAYEALYDAPESVYAQMRISLKRVEELCRIDESLEGVLDLLKPAQIAVEEAAATLRDYLGRLEADPQRLEDVESRLAGIEKLKRKYGVSIDEILAFLANVLAQIESVESSTDRKAALERQREELRARYESLAARLTARRRESAAKLSKLVQTELKSLAMERTVLEIRLQPAAWSESGADSVAFLV